MTLRTFKSRMIGAIQTGVKWRYSKHLDRAFDKCLQEFDPADIEGTCGRLEKKYGFPWMLLVSILAELLRYWLENRKIEQRQAFLGWQREMKAINERAA